MAKKRNKTPGIEAQLQRWKVNLPPKYKPLMQKVKEKTRRTLLEEVCIAIENHLKENGLWPPPPEGNGEAEESS